ncbi:hypothetical protein BDDG_11861, partial [Blastomyces dermatitidis ATCC 18188]
TRSHGQSNQNAVSTDISSFFLTHKYYMKVLNLLEIIQCTLNLCSSIQITDNI